MEKKQKKNTGFGALFALCMGTYLAAYCCRVNMAGALGKLGQALQGGAGWLGAIGGIYFFVYAAGQLINGFLGDRISPCRYVCVAIAGTAVVNLAVGFCRESWQIALVWAINGVFQSMFWGPMLRALGQRTPDGKQGLVATGMGASYLVGYVVSWVILGFLLEKVSWSWNFWVPALLMLPFLPVWLLAVRAEGQGLAENVPARPPLRETLGKIRERKLFRYVPVCMLMGVVKESISYWAPALFLLLLPDAESTALLTLALIPGANFAGLWISKRFMGKVKAGGILFVLFAALTLAAAALLFGMGNAYLAIFLIAFCSAMCLGLNNVLLGYLPLCCAGDGITSSLIGLYDFSSYMGAAVSTFVLGIVISRSGAGGAPVVWVAAAAGAFVLTGVYLALDSRAARRAGRAA